MAWGIIAGMMYGTSWQHGALVGFGLWAPCAFVGVPGPHAVVYNLPEPTTSMSTRAHCSAEHYDMKTVGTESP